MVLTTSLILNLIAALQEALVFIGSIICKSRPETLRFELSGFLRRAEEYHTKHLQYLNDQHPLN